MKPKSASLHRKLATSALPGILGRNAHTRSQRLGLYIVGGFFAATAGSQAANVFMTGDDGLNLSSFNTGLNWSDSTAPGSANNYFNRDLNNTSLHRLLRTPAGATTNQTFQGNSLTISGAGTTAANNEALMYKGSGTASIITINGLTINGGQIRHASSTVDIFNLAGDLTIGNLGATVSQMQGPINVQSSIGGSGEFRITGFSAANATLRTTFAGANSWTGNLKLTQTNSYFTLGSASNLNFVIGASGVNNQVSGLGVAAALFGGTFDFDLTGGSAGFGDSWTIVAGGTAPNFTSSFQVANFDESVPGVWNNGVYRFTEADGILQVIPEPSAALLGTIGFLALLRRRRN